MKPLFSSFTLLLALLISPFSVTMADESIQQIVEGCDSCHSDEHNKVQGLSVAPVLNGMPDWYIEKQMENFRTGNRVARGNDATEINTAHQSNALNEESLSLVADYYEELELRFSQTRPVEAIANVVQGSANNAQGEAIFEDSCASCHTSFVGRYLTDSPEITHLEGEYLLNQLEAFKKGERRFFDENKHQRKMVERIKNLSTEELLSIVSYIKENAQSL